MALFSRPTRSGNRSAVATDESTTNALTSRIPVFGWLPSYRRPDLAGDLTAGLTVAAMLIPLQGGLGSWLATGGEVRQGEQRWGIERQVRLVAGSLVVAGALGSLYAKPAVALAGFVGAGLTFSALTNTCGMAAVLSRLPYNKGAACDVRDVIAEMSTSTTRPAATAAAS